MSSNGFECCDCWGLGGGGGGVLTGIMTESKNAAYSRSSSPPGCGIESSSWQSPVSSSAHGGEKSICPSVITKNPAKKTAANARLELELPNCSHLVDEIGIDVTDVTAAARSTARQGRIASGKEIKLLENTNASASARVDDS